MGRTEERLSLVLAVVPWLYEHGGGSVEEVAEHFGLPEAEVLRVLSDVQCCEVPPYAGSTLGIAVLDDGEILVDPTVAFERPLRLGADEAFGLLVAARAALGGPGADPEGPLARAITKLAVQLGDPDEVDVDLDRPDALDPLRAAVEEHRRVRLRYYSAYRDAVSEREVDPWRLFSADGRWYLSGHCHRAGDARTFRVDRVEDVEITDVRFEPPPDLPERPATVAPVAGTRRVRLRVPRSAGWIAETYPVEDVHEAGEDLELTVVATGEVWLEQVLLRAGPGAEVLEPPELVGTGRRAAERILSLYDRGGR